MGVPPSDPRVDDLRQRLRSLGYLDAGVDRFVLGPARASRRPSSIALFASLRIGILAALMLGPAAAIGLTARIPGLVTGPRDAFVVALYLTVFFGIIVVAGAFVISLMVSWIARRSSLPVGRRTDRLSRAAGILVTLGCLVYLTLWWQTVIAGVGWSAPLWTASALAVAAAISLLLGHAVRVISSAVIMASAVDHATAKPADRSVSATSWRTTIAAGALTFAGAALLLAWTPGSTRTTGTSPPALTVVPSGLRVRVIAIDGFDARVFEDLSSRGRVPALTAAFGGALARLDQGSTQAEDPARIWTTVATGQPPEVHGVQQLEMRRVAGMQGSVPAEERSTLARAIRGATDLVRLTRPAIASGSQRRAKTFWEVAAEAGLRTSVVNWWATWPARGDAGIVLSDRATLRLEHGGPLDAEIAPASLYEPLRQRWTEIKARTSAQVHELLQAPSDPSAAALLQRSAELDAIQLALLAEVRSGNPDLAVVYLPGLDITQYALLGGSITSATGDHGMAASALSARLDALESYYLALDRLLAPLLIPAADELVIVITEPGRVAADSGARVAARGAPGGAMAGAGGLGAKGMQTDIAPTILYALGVPIARDLPGAPMMGLFARAFAERYPARFVATYGQPRPPAVQASGAPLDQEMIDRLRSLGYVR